MKLTTVHAQMIEFKPLLEQLGDRNILSISLTYGEYS